MGCHWMFQCTRLVTTRIDCASTHGVRLGSALACCAMLGLTGCVGAFADLHATGYPALRTAPHPTDGTPPDGPKPLEQVKAGLGLGITLGLELDDGRSSRWAVGYSADVIGTSGDATAHHHFNDLRVDVTVKTLDDDNRLRIGVGGGIGAGNTKLPRDDGGTYSKGSGSAVIYSGPVFVHYVGDHSALAAMLGGSFLIIGAGDYTVRGWGLTTHLTYSYSFDDSHADVVMYRALRPELTMSDFATAGLRAGCTMRLAQDSTDDVAAVFLSCPESEMEIHATEDMLHIHCERSTTERCHALFSRIEAALPLKK